MEYMITNYYAASDEDGPAPGTPEFNEMMGAWMAYNQKLIDGGHWVGGASLAPPDTATTISLADGVKTGTTDGPFAETKEQLGGFYLIEAKDLDEAIALAAQMPIGTGSLEIRPVAFRPDADHG